jgi:hypothetical protein
MIMIILVIMDEDEWIMDELWIDSGLMVDELLMNGG